MTENIIPLDLKQWRKGTIPEGGLSKHSTVTSSHPTRGRVFKFSKNAGEMFERTKYPVIWQGWTPSSDCKTIVFHVRRYEASFKIQLTVLDWDKITANDHICDTSLDVTELLKNAPKKDETTGLYKEDGSEGINDMQEFTLNLKTAKETPWEAKHTPTLTIRCVCDHYSISYRVNWCWWLRQGEVSTVRRITPEVLENIH